MILASLTLAAAALLSSPTSADAYFPSDENDRVAWCLISQGYRGLPDDGMEAIYAPASVIAACSAVYV